MTTRMSELTERRKADRAVMAKQVAALAEGHGIAAQVEAGRYRLAEPGRAVRVELAGPHTLALTVCFDGDSPQSQPDTYVLSWHMSVLAAEARGWKLYPPAFGNVNPYHGHKATDVVHGFARLYYLLECRFSAIADGSAFVSELPYQHTAEDYGRVSPRVAAAEVREPNQPGWRP